MAIIINYDLPDNITVNILPTGETVVNVLPKSPIVVNLCNDNGQSTTDYAALTGKPKINDIELIGNKTLVQLGIEPKRGADDFYVTGAEKAKLGKLLVDFTVPTDTPSVTFVATDAGVLLSTLNLKNTTLTCKGETNLGGSITRRKIILNGITTGYNNTTAITATDSAYLAASAYFIIHHYDFILYDYITYSYLGSAYPVKNPPTGAIFYNNGGFNETIRSIDSITLDVYGGVIKAGSNIKIYRND